VALSLSDIAAIRAAEQELAEAFEASDPTAWGRLLHRGRDLAGPGVPTIQGRAAFLEAARKTVMSSLQINVESTLGSEDFAATFGHATWVSGPKGSDAPVQRRRLLMVWRREPDGRWRIARELLNDEL
jgi:ketosteroid isomerase-like protein